jgi:hypothetical protein
VAEAGITPIAGSVEAATCDGEEAQRAPRADGDEGVGRAVYGTFRENSWNIQGGSLPCEDGDGITVKDTPIFETGTGMKRGREGATLEDDDDAKRTVNPELEEGRGEANEPTRGGEDASPLGGSIPLAPRRSQRRQSKLAGLSSLAVI